MTHLIEALRNGVDTEQMYGTLDAIKAQPEPARNAVGRHDVDAGDRGSHGVQEVVAPGGDASQEGRLGDHGSTWVSL